MFYCFFATVLKHSWRKIYDQRITDKLRRKKMTDDRIKALWQKGVQLMAEQYT